MSEEKQKPIWSWNRPLTSIQGIRLSFSVWPGKKNPNDRVQLIKIEQADGVGADGKARYKTLEKVAQYVRAPLGPKDVFLLSDNPPAGSG